MIDLRRLHVLRVVHQLGTVTAAAQALHLTPSAVSQQLRQLARELEVPLLEPDGRRVRLTAAAHTLLGHADDLAARWEQARGELHAGAGGTAANLRLAGFTSSLRTLVVPAVEHLRTHGPDITVRVMEIETAQAYGRVLTGDIDIAVTLPHPDGPPLDDPRFEQQPLLDEPQDLLLPRHHRLAERASVALEEAAQEPWVLPAPGTCDHHDISTAACAAAGFTPKAAHEAMDWSAVAALVAAGLGVCLKPRFVRVPDELAVVAVPLAGVAAPHRRILTCTRRGSRNQPHIVRGLDALRSAAAHATEPVERLRPVG
ncbi:LysR family transcriptional regulator [Pseudonocardia sp. MH-G8]|uniref:LysR family transcriptional regulator n=1 Tax=Pseudonocardia sp. MH-G8 TaxID=1854588 RepID=UPI000BA01DF9|nr:LysR family transcriptional regulator [Pseudonocardia sp. MH-G8]OZM77758.1 LysR family transcriptional regulator [Pseudonocardia sp. MH-G8]